MSVALPLSTFETMGTVVSLRAPSDAPRADVETVFAEADARFSLYRPDSEASRIARGDLALTAASSEMRSVYAESLAWREATDGAFTPHRPDGVIDLAGTVKARAMAEAAQVLGHADWLLAVGGDVLSSDIEPGAPWRVGVIEPTERSTLLCAIPLFRGRRAVATSGIAERGEHIWRSRHHPPGATFTQVTVSAGDILTADILATAILAGGGHALETLVDRFDVDVLTIDRNGELLCTDGMRTLLTTPTADRRRIQQPRRDVVGPANGDIGRGQPRVRWMKSAMSLSEQEWRTVGIRPPV